MYEDGRDARHTIWPDMLSSIGPRFSWEKLLVAADRRKVGEPVAADADILYLLFTNQPTGMMISLKEAVVGGSRAKVGKIFDA